MKEALLISWFVWLSAIVFAQDSTQVVKPTINYGSKGWEFKYGSDFMMNMEWRVQFRYTVLYGEEPDFIIEEEDNFGQSFDVQRARLKVGGHAYKPYLKYYLEYDFPSNSLLNWEITIAKWDAIQLKLGQWKVVYNTERFVSSGKQQLTDRSIANRFFTFDRQMGVSIKGDLFKGKFGCSSYNIGAFNGNGRMTTNNNNHMMYLARYQWNFSGVVTKKFFSDLNRVQKPEGFLAISAVRNQSAFTRFSTVGGGQLPGYAEGSKSQYLVKQLGAEWMLKYKGFSFMAEAHGKQIDDLAIDEVSSLYGGYAMAGYFFGEALDFVPDPLELTLRYGLVRHRDKYAEDIKEYSIGANYFFSGHRNKLTADISLLENIDFDDADDDVRFRIQWDISF
ncbi:MAG: porin [Reichenbachiella sp.]